MPNTNCTCDKILITQQSVAASFSLYPSLFICLQSSAVADTLYDIEWYKCDARTRKMILMILRRSQRAKTIAVPFFTPSLPAFSSVRSSLSLDYENKCLCFTLAFSAFIISCRYSAQPAHISRF